jgi:hypothetical protein
MVYSRTVRSLGFRAFLRVVISQWLCHDAYRQFRITVDDSLRISHWLAVKPNITTFNSAFDYRLT